MNQYLNGILYSDDLIQINVEDINSIDRMVGALDCAVEDMNQIEHINALIYDRNVRPHHLDELRVIAQRYCPNISVEGYMAVSTEGFLDVLKSMFTKIAQWSVSVFTQSTEKVAKMTEGTPPKAEDIKSTKDVESMVEKLLKLDMKEFSKLERLKMSEVISGKHDASLLKEFGNDQATLKAAKSWASDLKTAWYLWSSILMGGRDVDSSGEWVIGMAVRELKLSVSKGMLNTDGVKEALNRNFLIPKYMLQSGMVDKVRDTITSNAIMARRSIDEMIQFAKGSLPEDPMDAILAVNSIVSKYPHQNIDKIIGDQNIEIDDQFVNKYLAPLLSESNDILNVMKVKVEREVLASIKPFANGNAAESLIKEIDSPFSKKAAATDKTDEKRNWQRAEDTLVRQLGFRAKSVIRSYARYIKEMLYLQRFARQYIKLCKSLEKLTLE